MYAPTELCTATAPAFGSTIQANVRYWLGLLDAAGGELSGGNATWATNTPNRIYCMFRYSAGTDSTIKAICATSSGSQTVADTGVSVDTSQSQLYEIIYGASAVKFFINGSPVASVPSTLPATSDRFGTALIIDNQNTANNVSATFFNSTLTLK